MNPSAVPHFDQSGMPAGSLRILMSMRAVGEGHISSIAFRGGIITDDRKLKRSEEHTSELQSLMRISYAVFCLKKKKMKHNQHIPKYHTQFKQDILEQHKKK